MAVGQKLKLRLFLEGIEVPVIGAAIQASVNSPATASIQVIPTDRILELKPRTMVHLFYWDFNKDLPDPAPNVTGDSVDPSSTLRGYRLAFAGEMVGLVFMKTPTGRQTVLQCADFSNNWDTCYQIFISYSPNGNFLADNSSTYGGGNSMFDNISASHSGVMNSYLNSRPKTEGLQDVQGLMGGIISLLEAMGGVPNHVSGVNDFFTISELKNHLLQQIVAEQNDDTAQQLFDSKAFSEWLNRGITSMGELVSFRDMLKLLFHWVYYEVIPITSPLFIKAVPPTTTEVVSKKKAQAGALALGESQRSAIRDWITITNRYDGSTGVVNSLRNQVNTGEVAVFSDLIKQIDQLIGPDANPNTELPPRIRKLLEFIAIQKGSIFPISNKFTVDELVAASAATNTQTTPSRATGTGAIRNDVDQLYANQRAWKVFTGNLLQCLNATNPGSPAVTKKKLVKSRPTLDRLQTQIFRPDCFFVAPPRCNVLFPDQYTQFQFQRNYLQEVTRLRLSVGLEFISGHDSGLLTPIYFSPSNVAVSQDLAKKPGSSGIRTLLPWEKYTGILPKFESISEVNYIANKRQRSLQQNVKGQGTAYSQRAADFNFLKYRFAPRTLSISGKFNPQFVMGFPGLVIDQPFIVDPDQVNRAIAQSGVSGASSDVTMGDILSHISILASYFKAPTQYLGMPASLTHNVDQSGGTTNITFTHARTHRTTDDDFLAAYAAEITKKTQTQSVSTLLDADEILRSGDYKRLRFLIDATPQDQIELTTDSASVPFADNQGNPLDSADAEPDLDLRPNGAPNLATFDQLAPAIFATPNPTFSQGSTIPQGTVVNTISGPTDPVDELLGRTFPNEQIVRWVGPVSQTQLKGTSTLITVPNPYGKIKPGAPGLKNGTITQIQLLSDAVVSISTADIEQFVQTKQDRQDLATRRKNAGKEDRIFIWRKAIVWETTTTKTVSNPIPVEETVRPPWFSPLYSNVFIGDNIYQPFFGTGSIVDETLFNTPQGQGVTGANSASRDELLSQVDAANGDSVKIAQILDKFKATSVGTVPSIETAVDSLAYVYGEVRRQNLDVQKFIVNYTDRPIATMEDILGSFDLAYAEQNGKLVKLSGTSGFHSTAVAPFDNLLGLLDNPDVELSRIKTTGKKFPINQSLDPRPGRRAAVEAYAADFGSQGALGVGLRG